ncbi:MAG TPA: acyl-CoA dehydrogenase family protein [Thermoleophilaceae bacterium]|nr:acyl-CoA dehydrogenase family protein [Thermoleophilaceae bacterium]
MASTPVVTALEDSLTAEESALRDLARDFAAGEIAPHAAGWWQEERFPVELFRKMGELDLMGLLVPERFGGTGMSTRALVAALFEVGKADQSVAAAWQAHLTIGTLPLLTFGDDEQRDRWLTPIARGEKLASFGLTEPNAGSDAAGIQTVAKRVDGGWVVSGSKTFISNACTDMSLGPVILARVASEDAKDTDGGYVTLLMPKGTPGFSFGPKLRGIGWHALDSRELNFDDVELSDDHVVGVAGQGLSQFLAVLDVGRITVATLGISLAEAVLEMALAYAKERRQFGRTLSKFQAIQFKLADIAAQLEAVKLLVYRAAALRDAGKPFGKEGAMAKLLSSSLAVSAVSEAVQIHGGYGYMHEYPVARFYCDAKVLEIGEGTNEIQRLVIARHLGC